MGLNEEELLKIVAEILEVPDSNFSGDSLLMDMGWDSLAVLEFIAVIDRRFGCKVVGEALLQATHVRDLRAAVLEPNV